jgi:hypothetical protein
MEAFQAFLCVAVLVVIGVLYPIARFRLRSHIRQAHPQVWQRFGFPRDSYPVPPEHEREHATAAIGYQEFFSTGRFTELNDSRLNALHHRQKVLGRIGAIAFALLIVNFLVFRAAPDFSWLML